MWTVEPGASAEQQPHGQIRRSRPQRVLHHEFRLGFNDRGLPVRLILATEEAVPLIGLQAGHVQVLDQVVVNTRGVFTGDARQTGDGGAVSRSQLSGLFEAVSARHMLHDAPHLLMGKLEIPEGRTFQFTEFLPAGGTTEQPAPSGARLVPLAVTDIPETRLADGWTCRVEAAETGE